VPPDRLHLLRRSPRLCEQVVQQLVPWADASGLRPGDRLPAERDLAARPGVSRATLAQALVALEVLKVTGVVSVRHGDGTVLLAAPRTEAVLAALRARRDDLGDVIEARQALEVRLAALATRRRTAVDRCPRGGRPPLGLAGHRAIAEAIRSGDAPAAAAAMTAHIDLVSDVPLPADQDRARLRSGRASRPRG
jgi:GntR family transcriptional regulator, transcriptional repressor for pyruvate dehydrogenase complex